MCIHICSCIHAYIWRTIISLLEPSTSILQPLPMFKAAKQSDYRILFHGDLHVAKREHLLPRCEFYRTALVIYPHGNWHIPSQGTFEEDFPFPKMGYVSSLQGSCICKARNQRWISDSSGGRLHCCRIPVFEKTWSRNINFSFSRDFKKKNKKNKHTHTQQKNIETCWADDVVIQQLSHAKHDTSWHPKA